MAAAEAKIEDYGFSDEEVVGMVKILFSKLPRSCKLQSIMKRLKETFGKDEFNLGPCDEFDELQEKFDGHVKLRRGRTDFSINVTEAAWQRILEFQNRDVQMRFANQVIPIVCFQCF